MPAKLKPICGMCGEPILPGERLAPFQGSFHLECGLRAVVGGVNHLRGLCSCCGGTLDPDPEGVSKREAARMAADEWRRRQDPN